MVVVDFSWTEWNPQSGLDWRIAEETLDKIWISTSKSTIPDDPNPPFKPSWLRIGMPAMTTRWVKENDTKQIVEFMDQAFKNKDDQQKLQDIRSQVIEFSLKFPVPGI